MAEGEIACPKCRQQMHAGFVPDLTSQRFSGAARSRWIEGLPSPLQPKLGWFGIRYRNAKPITTYRRASCGYLESYAS